MTQDRNQQNPGLGKSQQQQQQGSSGKQQGGMGSSGQQGMGKQQGSGQQQQFSTQQGQAPQGSDVNQQMGGRQSGMGGQSQNFAQQIRPHMEVVDNKGQHIGTVDSCEGNRIKLTKSDSSAGQHRYLDTSQIQSVDGGQIRLSGGAQFLS